MLTPDFQKQAWSEKLSTSWNLGEIKVAQLSAGWRVCAEGCRCRAVYSAELKKMANINHSNGGFHIGAQGSGKTTSIAWPFFMCVMVPAYRTTLGKQRWFRDASNPDDNNAESRLKIDADYMVAAHYCMRN